MKKLFLFTSVLFLLLSCTKDNNESYLMNESDSETSDVLQNRSNSTFYQVDDLLSNYRTLLYTTTKLISSDSNEELYSYMESEIGKEYPDEIVEEFFNLDIEDENGREIIFARMMKLERVDFVESYLQDKKKELESKLLKEDSKQRDFILEQMSFENKLYENTFSQLGISILKEPIYSDINFNEIQIENISGEDYQRQLEKYLLSMYKEEPELASKFVSLDTDNNQPLDERENIAMRMSSDNYHNRFINKANMGDILITLHIDTGFPLNLFDIYNPFNSEYPVGHCGLMAESIRRNDQSTRTTTIEAWMSRDNSTVQRRSHMDWMNADIVRLCGLRKFKSVWKWKGWKSGYYTTEIKIDSYKAAVKAISYERVPYLKYWSSHAVSKWKAPEQFNCASLVWFCIKKEYGINVSHWRLPYVTPYHIWDSENIYLKDKIIL